MTHSQPLSLLCTLCLVAFTASKLSYKDMISPSSRKLSYSADPAAVIPLHRLEECPTDAESFVHDDFTCVRPTTTKNHSGRFMTSFNCSFTQLCFNGTMQIKCNNYKRECDYDLHICYESYGSCQITNLTAVAEKAPAPGIPAKFFPECIPAVDAIRDQCNANITSCKTNWNYDENTDELLACNIECENYDLSCYNYTRNCATESTSVINTVEQSTKKILPDSECEITTRERRLDLDMMRVKMTKISEIDGTSTEEWEVINYNRTLDFTWDKETAWENCTEATQVSYEVECNQYIAHMMEPLRDVIYEPRAHNLTEGIKMFLANFDEGYEILCKFDCFYDLLKFSRKCWAGLPFQRFLPGADYETLEVIFRNMTRIACYITDKPSDKFEEDYMNERKSCAIFFDPEQNITKYYLNNITSSCIEGDNMCNKRCNAALDDLAGRFGCCMGSIKYQYLHTREWLKLWNFADNAIIDKLVQCGTEIETQCESIHITALSVTIVRNLIYVIGGVMTLVVVIMTVSFYWQLEHEPIKKAFYHF